MSEEVRQYCAGCYGEAKKAGRLVRQTDVYPWAICAQCETRVRNGLIHYTPSNGTEYSMFKQQCETCRHYLRSDDPSAAGKGCAWGVLDKIESQMWTEHDNANRWFDPADLMTKDASGRLICPPDCQRYTYRGDAGGEHRDPQPPDVTGQLMIEDLLAVPEQMPKAAEAT